MTDSNDDEGDETSGNARDILSKLIDEEVRSIIDSCYQRSSRLLKDNMDKLHTMADALMLYETIDADQIDDIMEGRKPRPPKDWDSGSRGSGGSSVTEEPASSAQGKDPIGGPASLH